MPGKAGPRASTREPGDLPSLRLCASTSGGTKWRRVGDRFRDWRLWAPRPDTALRWGWRCGLGPAPAILRPIPSRALWSRSFRRRSKPPSRRRRAWRRRQGLRPLRPRHAPPSIRSLRRRHLPPRRARRRLCRALGPPTPRAKALPRPKRRRTAPAQGKTWPPWLRPRSPRRLPCPPRPRRARRRSQVASRRPIRFRHGGARSRAGC